VPIYVYRCRKGHTFEVMQSMSDESIAICQECKSPVERVFHPVAVHFKGSGFYTTDYGRKRGHGSDSGGGNGSKDKETTSAKSEASGESKSEGSSSKPDSSSASSD
jgi:putative FmdB family regulatory protein